MIRGILNLVSKLVQLVNLALVIYCLMSFLIPTSEFFQKVRAKVDPILQPVREWLWNRFPAVSSLPVDVTPLAVWLLLSLANYVLGLLISIFS